jgi:hypothetical protein
LGFFEGAVFNKTNKVIRLRQRGGKIFKISFDFLLIGRFYLIEVKRMCPIPDGDMKRFLRQPTEAIFFSEALTSDFFTTLPQGFVKIKISPRLIKQQGETTTVRPTGFKTFDLEICDFYLKSPVNSRTTFLILN